MPASCKIDNCDEPSRALGLCRRHYRAFKVHGDAEEPDHRERPRALCERPACWRHAESRGLCDTHYQRVRRGAEPLHLTLAEVGLAYGRERAAAVAWSKPRPTGHGDGVEPGLSRREIARLLGVSERTVQRWLAAQPRH